MNVGIRVRVTPPVQAEARRQRRRPGRGFPVRLPKPVDNNRCLYIMLIIFGCGFAVIGLGMVWDPNLMPYGAIGLVISLILLTSGIYLCREYGQRGDYPGHILATTASPEAGTASPEREASHHHHHHHSPKHEKGVTNYTEPAQGAAPDSNGYYPMGVHEDGPGPYPMASESHTGTVQQPGSSAPPPYKALDGGTNLPPVLLSGPPGTLESLGGPPELHELSDVVNVVKSRTSAGSSPTAPLATISLSDSPPPYEKAANGNAPADV